MKRPPMFPRRSPYGTQALPIGKRGRDRAGQLARFNVIVDGMDTLDQRTITLDAGPAAQRRGPAHGGFIGPEALPAEPFRRPYEISAPASRQILLKRKRGIGDVDRIAPP